jgi:polyisoprenoid-binding protein YceI
MSKYTVLFALAGILAMDVPSKPASTAGSWQVDTRHSDAQLVTDATTDYGNTKINVTLGFARVNGRVELNNDELAKSSFDFRLYPATAMAPTIDEDGKFLIHWLADRSNETLVCFHSKGAVRTADGRLQTKGNLILTRVDRNVVLTPSEAYAGPVYGPPMIHRISHEATFVFDLPTAGGRDQKDGGIVASGSTHMVREDYPQLVKAAVSTYWPPVVQDKQCQVPAPSEAYSGAQCTGTFLEVPALPEAPHATNAEDIGASQGFNVMGGNQLTILVHMHLIARNSGEPAAGGS